MMRKIFLKIYTIWVLIVFTVFMLILLPFIIIPILLGPKVARVTFIALATWSWIFSKLNFIPYQIIGKEKINRKRAYIYTSNHTSFLDVPALVVSVPGQFRPLAKKELLKIPIFGLIVRVVTIVVDRSSAESRKASLKTLNEILSGGISILIFPEGTQNRTKEPLQPFYNGAFRTAIETQTPILPMVIINAGRLMPPGKLSIKPGKVKIVFGDPIEVSDYDMQSVNELKDHVYDEMSKLLADNEFGEK